MDSLQRWLVKYETVLPLHDAAFLQTGYVYDNTRNSFRVHFQFLRRLNREEIKTMYPYQLSVYLFLDRLRPFYGLLGILLIRSRKTTSVHEIEI